MNLSEPEADTEYSRASPASRARRRPAAGGPTPVRIAVLAGGLGGAALLFVAEFLPLFEVRTGARNSVAGTVMAGPHHSWGLIPIAVLAAGLASVGGLLLSPRPNPHVQTI